MESRDGKRKARPDSSVGEGKLPVRAKRFKHESPDEDENDGELEHEADASSTKAPHVYGRPNLDRNVVFSSVSGSTSCPAAVSSTPSHPRQSSDCLFLVLGRYTSSRDRICLRLSRRFLGYWVRTAAATEDTTKTDIKEMIESSKIWLPIFCEDASSMLRKRSNLLKYMVDCGKRSPEKVILPVFYGIEPSQVMQRIDAWNAKTTLPTSLVEALREVANTSGWVVSEARSGEVISLIAQEVSSILDSRRINTANRMVGIERKVEHIMQLLNVEVNDKRIVGIYGMGGVGKTVLAKVVYSGISPSFEGCCFLHDIGETIRKRADGVQVLQTKLISDILKREWEKIASVDEGISFMREVFSEMKVLIVLDDLNSGFNLDELIGNVDSFGPGSRIIITARCKNDLPGSAATYEVPKMSRWEVLQLFTHHTLKASSTPDADYHKFKQEIVSNIGGLPLVVKVIGSFLSHKPTYVWRDTAEKLKELTDKEINKKLMISYEALNPQQKQIFMDIACFVEGEDYNIASYLWHDTQELKSLLDLCLVNIGENNELLMHSELRELGRQLWCQEKEGSEVENIYRPWIQETDFETLLNKKGIENVGALCLCFDDRTEYRDVELRKMPNVKFLQLDHANLVGDFSDAFLNMRWLHWEGCPQDFQASNFHMKSLVVLNLSRSKITESWRGWNQIMMASGLRVLNLSGCADLIITPDFSACPNLERLILEHCISLVKIDPSICLLKGLTSLNLKFCTELNILPKELGLLKALKELLIDGTCIRQIPISLGHIKTLETLNASGCSSLTIVPSSISYLNSLSDLSLDSTKITELPSCIKELVKLQRLSVRNCRGLGELPSTIGELKDCLLELDISKTGISELPDSIGNLHRLRLLKTESCFIKEFPGSILQLADLEEIHASYCRSLKRFIPIDLVHSELGRLKSLKVLRLEGSHISNLPSNLGYLASSLQTLDLLHCNMLKVSPELPSSLIRLRFSCKGMEKLPDLRYLADLQELFLADCDVEELIHAETTFEETTYRLDKRMEGSHVDESLMLLTNSKLKKLELHLSRIKAIHLPYWIDASLRKLVLCCVDLNSVPHFPRTLVSLTIRHCRSLETLEVGEMKALSELQLHNSAVREINGLHDLEALEILNISNCKLVQLDGLEELVSLVSLTLSQLQHLRGSLRLAKLNMLRALDIQGCRMIDTIEGLNVGVEIRGST